MTTRRHKYEYRVDPDGAGAKVIRMVGMRKRVLEFGPGPGSITRHLKENGCCVTALELDDKAIEIVAEFCERVYRCNLNDAGWPSVLAASGKFSAIVAADVLEHLYDPWTTLQEMRSFLAESGYLVVSLPHVGHNAIVACLLNGDFEYRPWGLLDKTHIRFWGMKNIQQLFDEAGFKIVEAEFVVKAPEQTEFASHWRKLPANTRQALACNRFGDVYQVVLRAVPLAAAGERLQLESLPVPGPSSSVGGAILRNRILDYFNSSISRNARAKIAAVLQRLGIIR